MRFKILAICALSGGLASAAAQALQSPEVTRLEAAPLPREYDVDLDLGPLDRLPGSCFLEASRQAAGLAASHGERQRWTVSLGAAGRVKLSVDGRSFKLGDAGEVVLPSELAVEDGRYSMHTLLVRQGEGDAKLARFHSTVVTFDQEGEGRLTGALELTAFRGCATEPCQAPVVLCTTELPFVAQAREPSFLAARR